jgi:hypothetical protein
LLFSIQQGIEDLNKKDYDSAWIKIGKTEGLAQTIYQQTAGYIQFLYKYDDKKLDGWIKSCKIDQNRKNVLKNYIKPKNLK